MPKVKLAPFLEQVYGSYGDEVTFRRTPKGKTSIIKKADMSRVKWSPAQVVQRQRMKDAIAYAQAILADRRKRRSMQNERRESIAVPTMRLSRNTCDPSRGKPAERNSPPGPSPSSC